MGKDEDPEIDSHCFISSLGSLVRFEYKNIFFNLENALAYFNAGVVAVNLIDRELQRQCCKNL
jgi:hypothetical protein